MLRKCINSNIIVCIICFEMDRFKYKISLIKYHKIECTERTKIINKNPALLIK